MKGSLAPSDYVTNFYCRLCCPYGKLVLQYGHLHIDSEVLQAVVYVLNRTPHQGVNEYSPCELFHTRKLTSLNHLRCLGATCYYRFPGHPHKLDMRNATAILVGYESDGRGTTAAYRFMDLSTRRVIVSVDVVFDERDTKHRANPTTNVPAQHSSVQPTPLPQHLPQTPTPLQLPELLTPPQLPATPTYQHLRINMALGWP
jgi:hypothetical protein